jgi:hypothetical protein
VANHKVLDQVNGLRMPYIFFNVCLRPPIKGACSIAHEVLSCRMPDRASPFFSREMPTAVNLAIIE